MESPRLVEDEVFFSPIVFGVVSFSFSCFTCLEFLRCYFTFGHFRRVAFVSMPAIFYRLSPFFAWGPSKQLQHLLQHPFDFVEWQCWKRLPPSFNIVVTCWKDASDEYISSLCRLEVSTLHQRVDEHKRSTMGYHVKDEHGGDPDSIGSNFEILKKCQNKLDCLIFEMLFIRKLKPKLNKQSDSIRAKLFT